MTGPSPNLAVFVSSTLGECKSERGAARAAIESLNFEPVLFEATGARPYPARATYLEGLYRSQICVIIWKDSYGYIDSQTGMTISGVEDEYRQAQLLGRDVFIYVHKDASKRDSKLSALIEDAKHKYTLYFFDDVDALREQIRDDITSRVSQVYTQRFSPASSRLNDPAAVLAGILPFSQIAITRPALEAALDKVSAAHKISWLLGPPGAGKTVLLAQWAGKRGAPYVNARGLSPVQLIGRIISAVSSASEAMQPATSVDEGLSILRPLWRKNTVWPVVIDDPADSRELAEYFLELTAEDGSLVIGTRDADVPADRSVVIPPLDPQEIDEITNSFPPATRASVAAEATGAGDIFPLALRKAAASEIGAPAQIFEDTAGGRLDPTERELLAFIVASPEPLSLDDIRSVSSAGTVVEIDGRLSKIGALIVDDGLGYRPVHDELAAELRDALSKRAGLMKFVCIQLAQRFARTSRYAAAFELYVPYDQSKALKSAQRAASQLAVEGALVRSIPALEFIAANSRSNGDRFGLTFNLLALAQANEAAGRSSTAKANLEEAQEVASAVGDETLSQTVRDQCLIHRIRRELKPADLQELREIRERYKSEGRLADAGRLAVEEGAILIGINDYEHAIPILKGAREIFSQVHDGYGHYVASKNLVAALNMSPDGAAEADKLLSELNQSGGGFGALRERAWICNILARRYRIDGLIDDAIEIAKEAVSIGEKLGDKHLMALNRIALGNALREKPNLKGALDAFKECSREAQALSRKETEALASRLAADVLVQMANEGAPYQRGGLLSEAENFATYAVGLLRESIATVQWAEALDTRGDARAGLGRTAEANADFALAARLFLNISPHRSANLIRDLAINIDDKKPISSLQLLGSAVSKDGANLGDNAFSALIEFIRLTATLAPRHIVGTMIAAAVRLARRALVESQELGLWLRLLSLGLSPTDMPKDGRSAFIFSAVLAQLRNRNLSITQLNALADLVLSKSDGLVFRSTPSRHLQASIKLGLDEKVLVTITDIDTTAATRFVQLAIASFLLGFREEINRDFLSAPNAESIHVHISLLDAEQAPDDMKKLIEKESESSAVAVAAFKGEGGERSLYVVCGADTQQQCAGDPLQATKLQFMYADIFRAILYATFGDQIEEEVLRPKIVALLRDTIQ